MLMRRGVAMMTLTGLLAAPALASAQAVSLSPVVTLTGGYALTDTIPDGDAPAVLSHGPFTAAGGALVLLYETPRTTQTLQANATAVLSYEPNNQDQRFRLTPNFRLNYGNQILLSELTTLTLGAGASVTPTNAFVEVSDASATPLDTASSELSFNFAVNGAQGLTRQFSPNDDFTQQTSVLYNIPIDAPTRATSLQIRETLSQRHRWAVDTGTLTLGVSYNHFGSTTASSMPNPPPQGDQVLDTLVAAWNRPLTPSLTLGADLGVVHAWSPDQAGQLVQPTGGADLGYDFDIAKATLSYTHGAELNVFTASINLIDQVALRLALPVGETGVLVSGTAGYTRSSPISAAGELGSATNTILTDAAVVYAPTFLPSVSVNVRGTYNKQIPVVGDGFTRISFIASLAYSFPSAREAEVQNRNPPAISGTPFIGTDTSSGTLTPTDAEQPPYPPNAPNTDTPSE